MTDKLSENLPLPQDKASAWLYYQGLVSCKIAYKNTINYPSTNILPYFLNRHGCTWHGGYLGKVKWILRTEKTEQNKQTSNL